MLNDREIEEFVAQDPIRSSKFMKLLLERIDSMAKKVMSFSEAAMYMGCSESYLRELCRKQLIARCKPMENKKAGRVFFLREDLDAFMMMNRKPSIYETDQQATDYVLNNRSK